MRKILIEKLKTSSKLPPHRESNFVWRKKKQEIRNLLFSKSRGFKVNV